MTRKDIIIVAVLVNAGLLATLFMLAINSDEEKVRDPIELNASVVELQTPLSPTTEPVIASPPVTIVASAPEAPVDEIDQALKAFSEATNTQPIVIDDDYEEQPAFNVATLPVFDNPVIPPVEKEMADPTKFVDVTVKKGDVLEKIAKANGTTVKAIKEANSLSSDRLNIGQVLKVPVGDKKVAKNTKKTEAVAIVDDGETKFYTVKSGDNPTKIAKHFQMKVDDLLKLNQMTEEKARNLKVGDRIKVK